jgi:hypothetical protein
MSIPLLTSAHTNTTKLDEQRITLTFDFATTSLSSPILSVTTSLWLERSRLPQRFSIRIREVPLRIHLILITITPYPIPGIRDQAPPSMMWQSSSARSCFLHTHASSASNARVIHARVMRERSSWQSKCSSLIYPATHDFRETDIGRMYYLSIYLSVWLSIMMKPKVVPFPFPFISLG